jgi:AmmeMemoRadiSam system protein B
MRLHDSDRRNPAVAGRFYPGDPDTLAGEVAQFLAAGEHGPPRKVTGVMAPHAGYVYSGGVAGEVFGRIQVPERVIILCPNHTGRGTRISVWASGSFRMPNGEIPIDDELAAAVLREDGMAQEDHAAHRHEHAIEVELPFLQARQSKLRIVPIVLSGLDAEESVALGEALHRAAASVEGDVLVVASSDMSHYLPDTQARKIDRIALEPLLAFDPEKLHHVVHDNDISMCGYIPATVMLAYARAAGATKPELISYATSGDAFGDRSQVVGYAGVLVS